MGVECETVLFVGLKKDYNYLKPFKDKKSVEYMDYLDLEELDRFENVLFTDYLPPDYIALSDGMGGSYSCVGKKICLLNDEYSYIDMCLSIEQLEDIKKEVIQDLRNINLPFDNSEVNLFVLTHCH